MLKILGRASDEKCDVLLVENLKSENKNPHITLSCIDGVAPKYAQELLDKATQSGMVEYFQTFEEVEVIEGYYDGVRDIIK